MKTICIVFAALAFCSLTNATKCYFCYGKACDSLDENRLIDCKNVIYFINKAHAKLGLPQIPENIIDFDCLSTKFMREYIY